MRDDEKAGHRDYGLGNSTKYVDGIPRVLGLLTEVEGIPFKCVNCGCETVAEIEVDIKNHPIIKKGIGKYLGCPACPWASPMVMIGR